MLRFTAATTLPNSVRSLAFETLTNLAEVLTAHWHRVRTCCSQHLTRLVFLQEAPHKLRKMTDFIHNAFSIAIHLYLEVALVHSLPSFRNHNLLTCHPTHTHTHTHTEGE
jgi:hypothetical protein